jgi:hypothetical protein
MEPEPTIAVRTKMKKHRILKTEVVPIPANPQGNVVE